jgi:formate dehydrogenase major subunit
VRRAIDPVGGAKADWEIICELARAMGSRDSFAFRSAAEIWDEVREVWPAGRGITYKRIEHTGLQWPCPSELHPGTALLHASEFPIGKRAKLSRLDYASTPETTSSDFPWVLMTGRTLYQFNAGTMTRRTRNAELRPTDCLDIGPADARLLDLADGDCVRLSSRYGESSLPVKINPVVKQGELFATFHTAEVFLNNLTSPHRDTVVATPEYKVTAVRIERK